MNCFILERLGSALHFPGCALLSGVLRLCSCVLGIYFRLLCKLQGLLVTLGGFLRHGLLCLGVLVPGALQFRQRVDGHAAAFSLLQMASVRAIWAVTSCDGR